MSAHVDVAAATGQARNFIYAKFTCNGYTCDSVFWRMMETPPPKNRAWTIITPNIISKLGPTVEVPDEFLGERHG